LTTQKAPVASLDTIETKWIELFDDLRSDAKIKDQLAALFLSVPALDSRSILYVGKATAGPWGKTPSGSNEARIKQRHEYTKKFLAETAPTYNSGFWQFARELDAEAAKKWKNANPKPLQHIAWTNVCKIGALKGNPRGLLFRRQRELSIETLRQEITLYKPRLICFVTWNYEWSVVKEVFHDASELSR
jgi:hypothetical protein